MIRERIEMITKDTRRESLESVDKEKRYRQILECMDNQSLRNVNIQAKQLRYIEKWERLSK